jgi:6-phosphogluconolactonase
MHQWNSYPEFEEASNHAADFLAATIETCLQEKGECHVILPGGNTPVASLKRLASKPIDWKKVHWYPGDERCYPKGHPERNDQMLDNTLWCHMKQTHIHRMNTELGAAVAAEQYRNEIKDVSAFDIAYLGMGEDGHTASLFPGHAALNDHRAVIPVFDSPKPPPDRVSLSIDTLSKVKIKVVLVGGTSKSDVIAKIKMGENLPINSIGDIVWFIDEAANTAHQ